MSRWWDDDEDDDLDQYGDYHPLWGRKGVYFRDGEWRCPCVRFTNEGICSHLVPFKKITQVEVKGELL